MARIIHLLPATTLLIAACSVLSPQPATQQASVDITDPMLRSALRDPLMVDPALAQQANADVVRPPPEPMSGAIPPDDIATCTAGVSTGPLRSAPSALAPCPQCAAARRSYTLAALAESQGVAASCTADISYSADWANRLPRGVPLYPDARVTEGAGTDDNGCALRAASFSSATPIARVLDFYYTRATDAGYRAQHRADGAEHVLSGARDGASFLVVLRSRVDGGTAVSLITRGGV